MSGFRKHWAASLTWVMAWPVAILALLQSALIIYLRYIRLDVEPDVFANWVCVGLILTGLIAMDVVTMAGLTFFPPRGDALLRKRVLVLVVLFLAQIVAGCAAWVSNLGWPGWFVERFGVVDYTIVANGSLQSVATTSAIVLGPCVLVAAGLCVLWGWADHAK